jgi:hypothetical protein
MTKPDPVQTLKELIRAKEAQHALEEAAVKAQFHLTSEQLKPINLIRNTIRQVGVSVEIRNGLPAAALGLVSDFVLRKIEASDSSNRFMKLAGSLLGMFLSRNSSSKAVEAGSGDQD